MRSRIAAYSSRDDQRKASSSRYVAHPLLGGCVQPPCPPDLEPHQIGKALVQDARPEILFGVAEACEILQRQIDPSHTLLVER
jgi:hypothetical protein